MIIAYDLQVSFYGNFEVMHRFIFGVGRIRRYFVFASVYVLSDFICKMKIIGGKFFVLDEEFERNLKFDFEMTEDMQDTGMYFIVFQNYL